MAPPSRKRQQRGGEGVGRGWEGGGREAGGGVRNLKIFKLVVKIYY